MAIINHNISAPNDGLGEELRQAFSDQNSMNAELYDTKVDKVAGRDLSENNYSNEDKAKVEALTGEEEKNVQADWNELDPTSDSYIIGKPIFQNNNILVSAIWTGVGLVFNATANAFPINGVSYAANPAEITLDAADSVLDRIDLIVAVKPVYPSVIGSITKITGTPASASLVIPPDYDPSIYYVIKQIIVRAGETTPENTSITQVYNEGSEWAVSLTSNITQTSNDPSLGTYSLEAVENLTTEKATFTNVSPLSTEIIDLLSFDFKLKEAVVGKKIYITFYLGSSIVKKYIFGGGENGFNDSVLSYQNITILKSTLNIPITQFDRIEIRPSFVSLGYFIDNVIIHTGSGADEINTGIGDAPNDGNLYGRKNQLWSPVPTALELKDYFDTIYAEKLGKRIVNATVTGAYAIDHSQADDFKLTLTGNTTFTDSNLPTGTRTIEFTMKIKGAFVPTFPAYWEIIGDPYNGAVWNFYSVQVHNGTTSSEEVTAFLTNLGA